MADSAEEENCIEKNKKPAKHLSFGCPAGFFYLEIQFFQIPSKCILPGGEWCETIGCQFALIQAAVKRSGCFGSAILCSCDGVDCHVFREIFRVSHGSGLTEDFFCEIIPADISALIGCMIITVFFSFDHIYQKSCQVIGISRCTDLVIDYGESIMSFPRLIMVLIKFLPFLPNTHAIRTIKNLSTVPDTASSPSSFVCP